LSGVVFPECFRKRTAQFVDCRRGRRARHRRIVMQAPIKHGGCVEYRLVRELARAGPRIEIERYPRMEMARDTLQQITWAIGIQSGLGRVDPLSQRCVDAGHLGIGIELADAPRRRCGLGMGRPGRLGLDRAAQPLLAYAIGQNRTGVFGTRLIARVDRLVRFVRFGERAGIGHSG